MTFNNTSDKATLIITLDCNSYCNFCPEIRRREKLGNCEMDYEVIKEKMLELKRRNYREIVFCGGEPTVHPQFEQLVELANNYGFQSIAVISNGRKFADKDYAKKLINLGIKFFNISIHAPNQEIANKVYRISDTWHKSVEGIRNLVGEDVYLSTNVVVCAMNYKYIVQIYKMLTDLGVKHINFRVCKQNDIRDLYFVPPLDIVVKLFNVVEKINRNRVEITLAEFPLCVFSKYPKLFNLCEEIKDNKNLDMTIISRSNENFMRNEYRQNCKGCKLNNICKGFDDQYFVKYKNLFLRQQY